MALDMVPPMRPPRCCCSCDDERCDHDSSLTVLVAILLRPWLDAQLDGDARELDALGWSAPLITRRRALSAIETRNDAAVC